MVGHIRYPWIAGVYARNKAGWLGSEQLRLVVRFPSDKAKSQINLELPKDLDATAVAAEIIRRTAVFRLNHEPDLSEEEQSELRQLAQLGGLTWTKGDDRLAGRSFSTYWPMGLRSARFGLSEGASS
jgi:hypothetical protein